MDLAEVKQVNISDLHSFLESDHTSFTTLNVSTKHIESTNRITVSLTKNSARSFYLNKPKSALAEKILSPHRDLKDDCLTDARNCQFFQFFNSKEKKLYTRFLDKVESNFESPTDQQPNLFLTLTFNTTNADYYAWTTNWNKEDKCWENLQGKKAYDLKSWAQQFDPQAEPLKVHIPQLVAPVSQYWTANYYLTLFLRRVRQLWKPSQWKWVVVPELQKNGNWHFHFLSSPIVPYSHKCTLDKDFKSCWNCRAYISQLWPYGRVESQSPGAKTVSSYLAKYLSKSFHLRNLYHEHGLHTNQKAYRFFKNLYDYQKRAVLVNGKSKSDQLTGEFLNNQQKIFRRYNYETGETSYFYRTNERLVGKCSQPILIKKNYRLGTRTLNPLSLLKLAKKTPKKPVFKLLKTPLAKKNLSSDFQEFLISRLLLMCKTAEFTHIPLEQEKVWKEGGQCSGTVYTHFQTKPVLRFTFASEQAESVREFIDRLDDYAEEYDMEESKDFYFYPSEAAREIWTPEQARNQYLDNWRMNYCRDTSFSY